jgi:hypothetical protein
MSRVRLLVEYPKTEIPVEGWDLKPFPPILVTTFKKCIPMTQVEVRFGGEFASARILETKPPLDHHGENLPASEDQIVKIWTDSINMFPPFVRLRILAGIKT